MHTKRSRMKTPEAAIMNYNKESFPCALICKVGSVIKIKTRKADSYTVKTEDQFLILRYRMKTRKNRKKLSKLNNNNIIYVSFSDP